MITPVQAKALSDAKEEKRQAYMSLGPGHYEGTKVYKQCMADFMYFDDESWVRPDWRSI